MQPSPSHSAATLDAVAARAGVSRATASRVLTGSSKVSDGARVAVTAAADALSYVANPAARSLAKRRSDSIAFVVGESEERLFTDPFFAVVLRGVQAVLAERELQLLFVVVGNDRDRERFLRFAGQGHIDGAILVSVHGEDPLPARLHERGVRVVMSGRPSAATPDVPFVDADNSGGGRQAAEVLLARGCQRIATVHGPLDMSAAQDRLEGFLSRLAEAGVARSRVCLVDGDFSIPGGEAAVHEVLRRCPEVDGVFAANDLSALGALQALADAGRAVPADVAVVGFDDVPVALGARPALTTVKQPIEAMGRALAQLLVQAVDGHADGATSVVLPTTLVRRGSA